MVELTNRCSELEQATQDSRERAENAANTGLELAQEVEAERDQALERLAESEAARAALEQRLAAPTCNGNAAEAEMGVDVRVRAMQQRINKLERQLEVQLSEPPPLP